MAGLVPAIHVQPLAKRDVDARDKPGHDELINMRFAPTLKNSLSAGRERE
jgi:hypothetical protein